MLNTKPPFPQSTPHQRGTGRFSVLVSVAAIAAVVGLGFGALIRFYPAGGNAKLRLSPEQGFPPEDGWPIQSDSDFNPYYDGPPNARPEPVPSEPAAPLTSETNQPPSEAGNRELSEPIDDSPAPSAQPPITPSDLDADPAERSSNPVTDGPDAWAPTVTDPTVAPSLPEAPAPIRPDSPPAEDLPQKPPSNLDLAPSSTVEPNLQPSDPFDIEGTVNSSESSAS